MKIRVNLPLGVEPRDVTEHFGKGGPLGAHRHGGITVDKDGNPTDGGILTMDFDDAEGVTEADVQAKVDAIVASPNDPTLPSHTSEPMKSPS